MQFEQRCIDLSFIHLYTSNGYHTTCVDHTLTNQSIYHNLVYRNDLFSIWNSKGEGGGVGA